MKRKLIIVVPCAVVALLAVFAVSNRHHERKAAPATQGLVVTQAGRLTLVPNAAGSVTMTLVVDTRTRGTNVPLRATEPGK